MHFCNARSFRENGVLELHNTFSRKRVVRLALTTSFLPVAAMAMATTTGIQETQLDTAGSAWSQINIGNIADRASKADPTVILASAEATAEPNMGVQVERLGAAPMTVNRARKGDRLRVARAELDDDALAPSAGAAWTLKDIFADYGEAIIPNVAAAFASLPTSETFGVEYSAFARPEMPATAPRLLLAEAAPLPRPRAPVPEAFLAKVKKDGPDTVLAYAPAGADLDAPFEAVISGGKKADSAVPAAAKDAEVAAAPRPKPGKTSLLGWLGSRNLKQFDPEQHSWASSMLPASVHLAKEQDCLARGIYFEARGEPELGQAAVAQVILNRVKAPAFPDTICGVVYQNKEWRNRCQFSFACDGIEDKITSPGAWALAQKVAREVTNGKVWLTDVGDATNYHANYVSPRWATAMKKVERIGAHIFYRTKNGGWS